MATVHLHVSDDPGCLLEEAAAGFLRPPPVDAADAFASPPHVLLVRQGGLRDDLIALAAERGLPGWFDPGLWVFGEIPERLGGIDDAGVRDYARVVLVERALADVAARPNAERGSVFGAIARPEAYADALDRFFGELVSEGVTPEAFEHAIARAPGNDAFERRRDAEVAAVYRRYRTLLEDAGATDARDRLLRTAHEIAASPDAFSARIGGRREVRILGLLDLKGGWSALLHALAASPALDHVRIHTSVDLPLASDLRAVREEFESPRSLSRPTAASEDAQFSFDFAAPRSSSGQPSSREVERAAFSAAGVEREAEEVAVRIRRLIEGGARPERIAVVARQARPAIDNVCAALDRVRVPVTARQRTGVAEIPVVRGVLTLFAAAADGWTRHGLVELAEQPYLGLRLDATVLNHIGYRRRVTGLDAWEAALDELWHAGQAAERSDGEEDEQGLRRERLPPSDRVERARAAFADFAVRARALDEARPLDEWIAWFAAFLEEDPWRIARTVWRVPAGGERIVRLDLAGWRGMLEIVREWRDAVARWGGGHERLDVAAFERRLRGMLSGDVALWTETRRGVQVMEALAAAQRSFEHVFLVGLDSDSVPVRAPRSPILDEADRARLSSAGLPLELRATWDARERTLLAALETAAGSSLTASYSRLDASASEIAASSFYEDLLERHGIEEEVLPTSRVRTPGVPLAGDADAVDAAEHAMRIEAVRAAGGASPWNGLIVTPAIQARVAERLDERFEWSPTALEAYAKCPWSWFSARLLRLAKLEDPEIGIEPRTRGTIFHDALRRFYDDACKRVGGPVLLTESDLDWAIPSANDALAAALNAAGEELWLGHEILKPKIRDELTRDFVRFVEAEIKEFNAKLYNSRSPRMKQVRTAVAAHEVAFDDVVLEYDGVRFRVRGTIDRFEVSVEDRTEAKGLIAAVDYKSSVWSTPGSGKSAAWADGVVLQVPLYAWVLTALEKGREVTRTEYRAIRKPDIVHTLQLHEVEKKTNRLVAFDEGVAKYEGARHAIADAVRSARHGRFPAAPAPSCGCPGFCHAWEICRVKDGPKDGMDW